VVDISVLPQGLGQARQRNTQQWLDSAQAQLERRIHSSWSDVFMNRQDERN
jgi:hypothetical protein